MLKSLVGHDHRETAAPSLVAASQPLVARTHRVTVTHSITSNNQAQPLVVLLLTADVLLLQVVVALVLVVRRAAPQETLTPRVTRISLWSKSQLLKRDDRSFFIS